ncbi:DUF960 domain-containing protein [Clostridium sp. P21]|uniref:DUF960 domain-containing protein n=2 Tax=Clostridium muellerianum TaxID=2716538 RepID=A0A7Y0EKG3_9CLOT|nr:DUF960 domain-containing protein [Clostridium muellerianum]NMM65124.1 DUF960 domain-containing protein [Clostridium muellerianum]
MFNNERYMTKGIQQEIPLELQLFLWNCIDTLKEEGQKLDYLQVFELTKERVDDVFFQKIEHRQEVPEYSKSYRLIFNELIEAKIFVIDDGTYSTMMLAEEY